MSFFLFLCFLSGAVVALLDALCDWVFNQSFHIVTQR